VADGAANSFDAKRGGLWPPLPQRAFMRAGLFDGCNFLPDHALNWDWTLRAMKCLLFESGVPTLT
jgi:hypothetical protein